MDDNSMFTLPHCSDALVEELRRSCGCSCLPQLMEYANPGAASRHKAMAAIESVLGQANMRELLQVWRAVQPQLRLKGGRGGCGEE